MPTPVWVVGDGDALAIWTVRDSGKVKRIRRDGTVLVGPCDVRGRLHRRPGARARHHPGRGRTRPRVKELLSGSTAVGPPHVWGSRIRRGLDGTIGIRITLTV